MHRWLNAPAVARWWPGWPSHEQVCARYAPRIRGEEPLRGCVIEFCGKPIGFIQSYRIHDRPDYSRCVDEPEDAAGIDLFIGEPDCLHRGFGPRIVRSFLRGVVFAQTGVVSCIIGPAQNNKAAIRAYAKAGFRYLKTISVPGELEPEYLMRIGRDEFEAASDRGSCRA